MRKSGREGGGGGGGGGGEGGGVGGEAGAAVAPRCCCLLSKVCDALQSSAIPLSHVCAREYTTVAVSGKRIVCSAPSI